MTDFLNQQEIHPDFFLQRQLLVQEKVYNLFIEV